MRIEAMLQAVAAFNTAGLAVVVILFMGTAHRRMRLLEQMLMALLSPRLVRWQMEQGNFDILPDYCFSCGARLGAGNTRHGEGCRVKHVLAMAEMDAQSGTERAEGAPEE